jgi:hypothetical protein
MALAGQRPTPGSFHDDAYTFSTFLPYPRVACFGEKVVRHQSTQRRVRATASMPILWTHNRAVQTVLPGMRKVFQTSLEVDSERTTKMPFSGDCHPFDSSTLKALNDIGSVYGLFKTDLPFHPDHYTCLFVGQTSDLRKGLLEQYDHPSITGVTHFFAEDAATEEQRKLRQKELIAEFNPPGNKLTGRYTNLPFKGPIPTPHG